MKPIDRVKLHTPKMFQPYSKILGTSKWPKTLQNSQFWSTLSHWISEIANKGLEPIEKVELHALAEGNYII